MATKDLPYGALYFSKIDYSKLDFSYTLIFGSDERIISGAWNFPYQGLRQIIMQAQLSNALLRNSRNDWEDLEISQGLRMFPILGNNYSELPFGNLVGRIVYPFGVSFLLPIFVVILVKEKEDRIQIMTKMNGLNTSVYYLAHYVHFFTLHILSSVFFLVTGFLVNLELFNLTAWSVLVMVWLTWGHAQIAIAFLLSIFFDKSGLALGNKWDCNASRDFSAYSNWNYSFCCC